MITVGKARLRLVCHSQPQASRYHYTVAERPQYRAHRPGHPAHQDQTEYPRPEKAVPPANRGTLQLPDPRHAHHCPGQNDQQERLLLLCGSTEPDRRGGRAGPAAVRKKGRRNAGGIPLPGSGVR